MSISLSIDVTVVNILSKPHEIVAYLLDLQDFSKGDEKRDGQEIIGKIIGNKDETANTPAQKNHGKKDTIDKDMKA